MYEYRSWYPVFLQSKEWKATAKVVRQRAKYRCERCGEYCGTWGHVHHKTYKGKDQAGSEWPKGWLCEPEYLIHLCVGCHEFCHQKSSHDPATIPTFEELEKEIRDLKY